MLDAYGLTKGITKLLQYSMQTSLQYPSIPFIS